MIMPTFTDPELRRRVKKNYRDTPAPIPDRFLKFRAFPDRDPVGTGRDNLVKEHLYYLFLHSISRKTLFLRILYWLHTVNCDSVP